MSLQHFAKRLLLALFLLMVVIVSSTTSAHHVNAQGPAPFLITPYFGAKGINAWFDHHFPDYNRDLQIAIYDGTVASNQNGVCGSDSQGNAIAYFTQPNGQGQCIWYEGHDGIDFSMQYEHVVAAAAGTVSRAEWSSSCHNGPSCGYGMVVEINHSNGYFTRYGHFSAIAVGVGQQVSAGQIIGTSGNTGNSTGAHLHFGVLYNPAGTNNKISIDPFGWSGTGADPWAQQQNGATSYCLWKDGEWANVCGGKRRPISEPINGGETFTYVSTNNTGGFSKGENNGVMPPPFNNACTGDCANWAATTSTYGYMYSTLVNGSVPDSWAKWQAAVSPNGGMYEVFVYIPLGANATSWQAPYTIRYFNNATQTTALVDQYGLGNQWVSLGTYYMTSNDYVFITDATGESLGVHCGTGQYCKVGADAVKFVRRGTTYLPYLNTTDGWMSTVAVRNNGGGTAQVYLSLFDNAGSLQCSSLVNVAAHATQPFAVTAASCPAAKSAIMYGSQDLAVVVREENGSGELNAYNGLLASGGSPGWERVGTAVHAPIIKNNYAGRKSKLLVANAGASTTTATIKFYNAGGSKVGNDEVRTLGVNASVSIPATQCPASSVCSAKITSSSSVSLAVSILEQDVATTQSHSTHNGFSAGATSNFVPVVKKNYGGHTTSLTVQNAGSDATTVTAICYPQSGSPTTCSGPTSIPAKATGVFVLNVSDGYLGSAVVSSTGQPIATLIYESGSPFKLVSNAPLQGTYTAYAPDLYGNKVVNGQTWNSGLQVQNVGGSSATVSVAYYHADGTPAGTYPATIGANRLRVFNTASGNLPTNFSGNAVIVSDQPIAATVNNAHTGSGDTKASYTVPNR